MSSVLTQEMSQATSVVQTPLANEVQQEDVTPKTPILKQPSNPLVASIYNWQPTGLRVNLELPLVEDPRAFMFLLRVSPLIATPQMCMDLFPHHGPSAWGNLFPLRHDFDPHVSADTPGWAVNAKSPIKLVQHSAPPFISLLALSHARWRGGLSFRFRTSANFTNQGNVVVCKVPPCLENIVRFTGDQVHLPFDLGEEYPLTPTKIFGRVVSGSFEPAHLQAAGYINTDVSAQKHIETMVPYALRTDWADNREFYQLFLSPSDVHITHDKQPYYIPRKSLVQNQWIAFALKGGIDGGAGTKIVSYEIDIKAEPDFQVDTFIGNHRGLLDATRVVIGPSSPPLPITIPSSKWVSNETTWTETSEELRRGTLG